MYKGILWFTVVEMQKAFIKYPTKKFQKNEKVNIITCTYSGQCFLCSSFGDDQKREWIMDYDIERIDK